MSLLLPPVELRHYCRNKRCRSKLPVPTEFERNAFCCRGCFTSHYRNRCMVCDQPYERSREGQLLCGRRKCKARFRANRDAFLGRWAVAAKPALGASENPANTGIKMPLIGDRPINILGGYRWPDAGGIDRRVLGIIIEREIGGVLVAAPEPDTAPPMRQTG